MERSLQSFLRVASICLLLGSVAFGISGRVRGALLVIVFAGNALTDGLAGERRRAVEMAVGYAAFALGTATGTATVV